MRPLVAVGLGVAAAATAGVALVMFREPPVVPQIDLTSTLSSAERRPAAGLFALENVELSGENRNAIATPGASRITWEVKLPDHARLHLAIGLRPEAWTIEGDGVLFRIGISDGRIHEDLVTRVVNPFGNADDRRWIPITVDLHPYSGFKWSLFYQPRRKTWAVVLNTSAGLPGSVDSRGDLPLWSEPAILGVAR